MGVMACDRNKCVNIMCDFLILDGESYICYDCMNELHEFRKTWPNKMKRIEVRHAIEKFMTTSPGTNEDIEGDEIEDEFKRLIGQNKIKGYLNDYSYKSLSA